MYTDYTYLAYQTAYAGYQFLGPKSQDCFGLVCVQQTPGAARTRSAQSCSSLVTSCRSSGRENGRKYTTSLMRPRNSSRRKCRFRIGCTTESLNLREMLTRSVISTSSARAQHVNGSTSQRRRVTGGSKPLGMFFLHIVTVGANSQKHSRQACPRLGLL